MAVKQFSLDGHLEVSVYKRKGARNMRLTVAAGNKIRVTIPYWIPYAAGLKFAESKKVWIYEQIKPKQLLGEGQMIGKSHKLSFVKGGSGIKTRVSDAEIRITIPENVSPDNDEVQRLAETACNRALKSQAEKLLPPRLKHLADLHGFSYKSVSVKRMKSRWGSCDTHKNIILNIYLMQLPWEVIDYVLLHELTHTKMMKHGPEFWDLMERVLPGTKHYRKAIRGHKPHLMPQ